MNGLWSFPNQRIIQAFIDSSPIGTDINNPRRKFWEAILGLTHKIEDFVNWCLRWVYAQHNARVLRDMEKRMVAVICEASGDMMSKAYYTEEAMLTEIKRHHEDLWRCGYNDAIEDARTCLSGEFDAMTEEFIHEILDEMKIG